METRYIETNKIKLRVVIAGPKTGTPVFLLHGFPDFWFCWEAQIKALIANGFRVIVPDQRGYNLSDKPSKVISYRQKELIQDIIDLADVLKCEQFHLVGHDFGGIVSWGIACLYPERVKKLVIISSPHLIASLKYSKENFSQKLKSWYILLFQLPFVPERLLKAFNYRLLVNNLPSTLSEEMITRYRTAWGQPNGLHGMINWYRALMGGIKAKEIQYGRVSVPTQIIWGANDKYLEAGLAKLSLEQCEIGKLTVFEKTSHWVMHERPTEVNALLLDHFRS